MKKRSQSQSEKIIEILSNFVSKEDIQAFEAITAFFKNSHIQTSFITSMMRTALLDNDKELKLAMSEAFLLLSDEEKLSAFQNAFGHEKPAIATEQHNAKMKRKIDARKGGVEKRKRSGFEEAKAEIKQKWLKERKEIIAHRGKAKFYKAMQGQYRTYFKDENGKDTFKDLIEDVKTIQRWVAEWEK